MEAKKFSSLEEAEIPKEHWPIVQRWVDRGDGVAVYENSAFDSTTFGGRKYVSYGSGQAQLETDAPPKRLPDIGHQVNWMYQLVGTYRKEK